MNSPTSSLLISPHGSHRTQNLQHHNPHSQIRSQPQPQSLQHSQSHPQHQPQQHQQQTMHRSPSKPQLSIGEQHADTMANLKLRRLTNLTDRLRRELNYERIPASQACAALIDYTQNVSEDPTRKDYLVPEIYGHKPKPAFLQPGSEAGGMIGAEGLFEDEADAILGQYSDNKRMSFSGSSGGCCNIS